jgi:succinate dehydrogenase / fumarate reductase membrane anchor subunit
VGADYQVAVDWLQSPVQTSLLLLFILVSLFHAQTGIQVVIEDYVHTGWLNMTIILLVKGASLVMAAVALVSILKIFIGSGS